MPFYISLGTGESQHPLQKATIQETSKAVDTDWFAANITPTEAPANHRIYIRVATTTIINLQMDDGTNTNLTMNLNDGVALDANDLYAFDIVVPAGYSYNIQHKTGTQNINGWIVETSYLA
jgi:hypothetical protein|tara:strand:- start:1591 stop:1953 length:363 start_codon:yes stop_codon:yes gene_type:complete